MSDKYVNGRRAVMQMLDVLLAEERNISLLRSTLQVELEAQPMMFFKTIVMPLLPKEQEDNGGAQAASLRIELVPAKEGGSIVDANTSMQKVC